jgi:hypothetical protein
VTANTDTQLRTKTWAELGKWYQLFIARQLFTLTATAIFIAGDPDRQKTWRIDQIPWSKERSEAFAGLHNQGKRIVVIFDEASAIDDLIWDVTEGALTDAKTQILWLRYGNPTKTSGRFFKNCTQGKRNTYVRVDSRTVSFTNKKQIEAWIEEYGEDSDFVRVRVKGEFPRAGYANFISPELVGQARRRRLQLPMYQATRRSSPSTRRASVTTSRSSRCARVSRCTSKSRCRASTAWIWPAGSSRSCARKGRSRASPTMRSATAPTSTPRCAACRACRR